MLLLTCALFLSGCAVKFVYNQLDWAIPWYLSDYMSLDGEQEDAFDERLDAYLNWHRKTQLPLYAEFLNKVASELETGLDDQDIAYIRRHTGQLAYALIERLGPDMVALFQHATEEQLEQLFEKFEEDNQEYSEEYIEPSEKEQRKQRAKIIQKYIERWTGRLSDEQQDLIREGAQRYHLMGLEMLDAKIAWQKEFERILAMRDQPENYQVALTTLMMTEGYGQSEEFNQKLQRNEAILKELYLKLDKSLTDKQRQHAIKKLKSYADDFQELAES
ncbi:MAG: DUF6279 family lipoprotein [Pseudomonadales bacterium]|nr:DUF6279 family lipoprotein [Pseudomonadales bacterium]